MKSIPGRRFFSGMIEEVCGSGQVHSVVIPDAPDTLVLPDGREDGDVRAGIVLHLSEDAAVFCITKSQMQPDGISGQLPGSGEVFTSDRTVLPEIQDERFGDLVVDKDALVDDIIAAGDGGRIHGGGNGFPACGIREQAGPALFVDAELLDLRGVVFSAAVEAGVAADIPLSVLVNHGAVMAGCHVGRADRGEDIVSGKLETVPEVRELLGILPVHVLIVAIRCTGTENADLISSVSVQGAVGYKQIIPSGFSVIQNIRAFHGLVIAAHEVFAEIRIDVCFGVSFRMDDKTGGRIELQQEDAAGPGTVDHPETVVFVKEDGRIQGVGVIAEVVFSG